jgi:hypothetical protein
MSLARVRKRQALTRDTLHPIPRQLLICKTVSVRLAQQVLCYCRTWCIGCRRGRHLRGCYARCRTTPARHSYPFKHQNRRSKRSEPIRRHSPCGCGCHHRFRLRGAPQVEGQESGCESRFRSILTDRGRQNFRHAVGDIQCSLGSSRRNSGFARDSDPVAAQRKEAAERFPGTRRACHHAKRI